MHTTVTVNGVPRNVEWRRTDEYLTGNVDGTPFRFMLANRQTAIREAEKAARALAAWTAILRDMAGPTDNDDETYAHAAQREADLYATGF